MRILAIGDIHGCSTALDALLEAVAPEPEDWIVTLGDYIDRGPDSRGVVERVLKLAETGQLVALRGNHEQMLLELRESPELMSAWLDFGGQATLDSYAQAAGLGSLDDVPERHWKFFQYFCVDWFEANTHFFVHGGVIPHLLLADQPTHALRWEKFVNPQPHRSGKVMVCGHTAQRSGVPVNLGYAVCIDTWVYGDGWLTCFDTISGRIWQANQRGETRQGHIRDYYAPRGAARQR